MSQPNILMIMADQLPASAIGAYGHPMVQTPHEEEPLLFDLKGDPHEVTNCVGDGGYAERIDRLKTAVHDGWDPVAVRAAVIESQQRRHVINEAFLKGRVENWDVQPHFDASAQFVREYDAQQTSRRMRYPRVGG